MHLLLQADFIRTASDADIKQLGLIAGPRYSLGEDLDTLPIEQRLQRVQVVHLMLFMACFCKSAASAEHL